MNTLQTQFIETMRLMTSSVSVVTTDGISGKAGITVSSANALCADPPSMLLCINNTSSVLAHILQNKRVCINLLSSAQQIVADSFAGRITEWKTNKFACANWTEKESFAPALVNALANIHCQLVQTTAFGTHTLLMCEILEIKNNHVPGLVYVSRHYSSSQYLS